MQRRDHFAAQNTITAVGALRHRTSYVARAMPQLRSSAVTRVVIATRRGYARTVVVRTRWRGRALWWRSSTRLGRRLRLERLGGQGEWFVGRHGILDARQNAHGHAARSRRVAHARDASRSHRRAAGQWWWFRSPPPTQPRDSIAAASRRRAATRRARLAPKRASTTLRRRNHPETRANGRCAPSVTIPSEVPSHEGGRFSHAS